MRLTVVMSIVALAVLAVALPQPVEQRIGMSIPITEHSLLVNANRSINLHTFDRHVASVKAKIRRGLDNYKNNTGMDHPSSVKRVGKRANVPLTEDFANSWYGTILVGSLEQEFKVIFDTGSADLIIPSCVCRSCEGHSLWDPTLSSSARFLDKSRSVQYGDGASAFTYVYTDRVSIAGSTAGTQTIGAATDYSPELEVDTFPADGLMGMGFQSLSLYRASPVFQTLVSLRQVAKPVFSFKLSNPGAELCIGGSNPDLYRGGISYAPVTVEGFWEVNMDNVQGNDWAILFNRAAVIDTGSNLIFVPSRDLSRLRGVLGGTVNNKGHYTFRCGRFPTIRLSFGGTTFPIAPSSLNLGPVSYGSSKCQSSLVAHDESFWLIGTPFLQDLYTVFDFGNARVGFAQLA